MDGPTGFSDYVAQQRGALVRLAYLLAADRDAAEDLVQTALVRVWPRWERVSQGTNPHAYVRKVLLSVFLNARRRWSVREVLHPGLELEDTRNAYGHVDEADLMMRYLRQLPRRQRAVIVLRYYADLSEADIAEVLGCSPGTVKSQSAKALVKLRALLSVGTQLSRQVEGGR
ncbi:SigE family RNA polymerase sigma factor [Streptacidiphilus jiangxiensis]|uniref:RNA polymerase sigma-70 factor, sigma-E family n=1 Tax=Streptacidiphilus jiangxiensis TaxID=235985 RepID=A0A1H7LWU3_STRJI|nr:SigE family RNA polymerase sigma factor [Streptacidiphilus jiangxiensis]SEL03329.1 RNA polymerase sigma-70 factor, sigma-E family [Streptacidiphilus jiangxiensis]